MFTSLAIRPHARTRIFIAILLAGSSIPALTYAQDQLTKSASLVDMSESERSTMAQKIMAIANRVANESNYFDEEMRPVYLTGSFDVENNVFHFDMEERFGPEAGYHQLADLHRAVEIAIEPLTNQVDKLYTIYWTYGGKDIEFWMPRPPQKQGATNANPASAFPTGRGVAPVVVAAGHGYYYHLKEKNWKPHREPSNGILEDEVTPILADELVKALRSNNVLVEELRPIQTGYLHEPSGRPWWHIGPRYRFEKTLPDHPEIWHSLPTSTDAARDRREDIKSRPLYANHVGSPAIIHVHTNAHDKDPTINGARVYVAERRPEDAKLAKLALCSMSEAIHSVDRFKAFKVAAEPHSAKDDAENNLASMPSIIVETAFHTNVGDAELLKDPEFRKISMMGVAKGYRLYTEGKSCQKFAIEKIAAVDAFVGQQVNQSVKVSGHPVFPVDMIYKPSRCRREPCEAERKLVFNQAGIDAFRVPYFCAADDVAKGPIDFSVWAKDAWGVKTDEVIFHLSCKARSR